MKYELNEEQIKAIYNFAKIFTSEDLHKIIGNNMTKEDIDQLNCVLDSIYYTFQYEL